MECQALRRRALFSPLVPHSGLHHHPFPGQGQMANDPEPAYDTLSLESSDSLETNLSLSGNSACSPDNASRSAPPPRPADSYKGCPPSRFSRLAPGWAALLICC